MTSSVVVFCVGFFLSKHRYFFFRSTSQMPYCFFQSHKTLKSELCMHFAGKVAVGEGEERRGESEAGRHLLQL